ncbi:hypothetical protein [Sphingomonas sp.]|uniref:hypothetical protein n=1 Tax=Sphingomonas sp. TaxID=28214 RepID=UPI0025F73A32|nr:hypothetical protein [Sphingomonas sp.]
MSRHGVLGSDVGLRWGSGQAALFTFLWLLFFVAAIVLVVMGFDLEAVDRWLNARAGLFDHIGDILFRIFFGFVLAMCGLTIWTLVDAMRAPALANVIDVKHRKKDDDDLDDGQPHVVRRSLGILVALVIGWFAWMGVTARY